MSAHWALQEAAFTALAADAGMKALIGDPARLYDDVPRNAAFPYVAIGEGNETDWSVQAGEGMEARLVLHAWSRYAGRREVKLIVERMRAVLNDAALTLSGWRLANLRFDGAEYTRGPGGAYHGMARFRAALEKI